MNMNWKSVPFANVTGSMGNFSEWMSLGTGQCVAVTGMASCGGVIIASRDLSKVAAAHVGGQINYSEEREKVWCQTLLKNLQAIKPAYLLVAGGPQGLRDGPARALEQFRKHLEIESNRTFSIAACQDILLARVGAGIGYASFPGEIPFRREGQAVREVTTSTTKPTGTTEQEFGTLESGQSFDDSITEHYYLLLKVAIYTSAKMKMARGENAEKQEILTSGKLVAKEFYGKLSEIMKMRFLQFNIFKTFPDLWK